MEEGKICADKTRLDVDQTSFGPVIGFDYRTFRYDGSVTSKENDKETPNSILKLKFGLRSYFLYQNKQKQLLTCTLRLDQIDKLPKTEPDNCSCYKKTTCEG